MRRIIIYLFMVLFLMPACSSSKRLYGQKRGLMILDNRDLPKNKKYFERSRKYKKSKRRITKRRR